MESVAPMEVKSFLKGTVVFEATMKYIEKYGRWGLYRFWYAKESMKEMLIDMLWLWEKGTFIDYNMLKPGVCVCVCVCVLLFVAKIFHVTNFCSLTLP